MTLHVACSHSLYHHHLVPSHVNHPSFNIYLKYCPPHSFFLSTVQTCQSVTPNKVIKQQKGMNSTGSGSISVEHGEVILQAGTFLQKFCLIYLYSEIFYSYMCRQFRFHISLLLSCLLVLSHSNFYFATGIETKNIFE